MFKAFNFGFNEIENDRCNINTTRSRNGYEYATYKMCLSMIIVMWNKQHLSNIWSWIHEKVKQHWDWVEKSVAYKKSVYL